ncbi:hypothetical protein GQ54DRAFT_256101 [Martensiomyces pterosporus]|nr:hypothetical protein GQ54DRAFT_256101 [Martensiomyces pterosporus]
MGRLPLSHRLAVALRYLDDASLMRYLRRVCRLAVRSGGLDGLIVTGIASYGMLVLGQYVDDTADVQTAALVATFDPEGNLAAGEPAERWIYAYRHLLNKWRMFTTRCLFDIAHGNRRELKGLPRMSKVGQEISIRPADVRCTFCHQSLGYDVNKQRAAARRGGVSLSDRPSQTRLLYTHCPKCSNSLPRCVVCRMTLGTPVVSPGTESDSAVATGGEFSQWFSWCQTCGHGGHVSHLKSWFSTHAECPIPGCSCECEKSC